MSYGDVGVALEDLAEVVEAVILVLLAGRKRRREGGKGGKREGRGERKDTFLREELGT